MSVKKERLISEIKQSLSTILMTEIKDPRLGFATIMRVELSADFRHAKVYVSILGSESEARTSMRCLKSARGYVQHELGRRLSSRYTPVITWVHDQSLEKSMRIQEILKKELADSNVKEDGDNLQDGSTDGELETDGPETSD